MWQCTFSELFYGNLSLKITFKEVMIGYLLESTSISENSTTLIFLRDYCYCPCGCGPDGHFVLNWLSQKYHAQLTEAE